MNKPNNYAYKTEAGKVYVTPIDYLCTECGFHTTSREEERDHYYSHGHFLRTSLDPAKTEEWNPEKHGLLPTSFEHEAHRT